MFFPFVLLLLTCLANSSYSEVAGSSQPLGKPDSPQSQNSNLDYDSRQRRLRRDLNDLKDSTDIFEDSSAMRSMDLEVDGIPQPLLLFLQKMCQLQGAKLLRVKTPRLGRTLDLDNEDDRMRLPFGARVNKKNVPFKPRLGKRTCLCDAN